MRTYIAGESLRQGVMAARAYGRTLWGVEHEIKQDWYYQTLSQGLRSGSLLEKLMAFRDTYACHQSAGENFIPCHWGRSVARWALASILEMSKTSKDQKLVAVRQYAKDKKALELQALLRLTQSSHELLKSVEAIYDPEILLSKIINEEQLPSLFLNDEKGHQYFRELKNKLILVVSDKEHEDLNVLREARRAFIYDLESKDKANHVAIAEPYLSYIKEFKDDSVFAKTIKSQSERIIQEDL
jgi:hypothetical protein